MPTPFTHLAAAGEILSHPLLAPAARAAVAADQPAFLLGNIAPDVQTVSGQPREATHFFPVPLRGAPAAPRQLLDRHRALARPSSLPPAQAAFLAGYLAHLVYDQLWIAQIFEPVFGPEQSWADFRERLYLHNALRTHMDADDLARLAAPTAASLKAAEPSGWLPFEADPHLRTFRDLIADQLGPGAGRTVEVFAQRMRVDPAAFARLLASPDEMQAR
ncbi:MAG: zinc dependent phospholipase C family protein, partial [Anaerolineales bacterium]